MKIQIEASTLIDDDAFWFVIAYKPVGVGRNLVAKHLSASILLIETISREISNIHIEMQKISFGCREDFCPFSADLLKSSTYQICLQTV